MSTKKTNTPVDEAVVPVIPPEAIPAVEPTKEQIKANIDALVAEYNESAEFAEFTKMRKIGAEIAEKVGEYNAAAERECFDALKGTENPLLEAVKLESFQGIAAGERKSKETGKTEMKTSDTTIYIDPLRLYERIGMYSGKVGADPQWPHKIQHLSAAMIVTIASEYGQKPSAVWNCLDIDEATRTLGPLTAAQRKSAIEAEVKGVIEAMIGPNYQHIPKRAYPFLRDGHTRKSGAREIGAIKPRGATARNLLMDLCNCAVNGTEPTFTYAAKKK